MSKLVIGPEGFVDLRKNPPPTTVTVQGGLEPRTPAAPVATLPEPAAAPSEEPLPGRQKTAEGLAPSVAGPVKVPKPKKPVELRRLASANGPDCYAIVTKHQWDKVGRYAWTGTKRGYMFRKVTANNGTETVRWLHRDLARANKANQFVGFRDGDERNNVPGNLVIFSSKEELHAFRRQVLNGASGSSAQRTPARPANPT
jgi:hypothetical protein